MNASEAIQALVSRSQGLTVIGRSPALPLKPQQLCTAYCGIYCEGHVELNSSSNMFILIIYSHRVLVVAVRLVKAKTFQLVPTSASIRRSWTLCPLSCFTTFLAPSATADSIFMWWINSATRSSTGLIISIEWPECRWTKQSPPPPVITTVLKLVKYQLLHFMRNAIISHEIAHNL